MPLELKLELDARNLRKFRTLLRASRTEAAKALTFTAEKAQTAWRLENHRVFHMRNGWMDKGIRKNAATPSNLNARVGTIDKFAGRHVIGVDLEKGHTNSHGIFVKNYDGIATAPTHSKVRSALRSMARTRSKPFWIKGFLFRRLGKGHDAPLTLLGEFRDKIMITPKLDAMGVVDRTVQREFPRIYERLLLNWAKKN